MGDSQDADAVYRSYKWSSMAEGPVPLDAATRAAVDSMYERMDANGDGMVSQQELEEFVNILQHQNHGFIPPHANGQGEVSPGSSHTSNRDLDQYSMPSPYNNNREIPFDEQSLSPAHTDSLAALHSMRSNYGRDSSVKELEIEELKDKCAKLREELAELKAMQIMKSPSAASTSPTMQNSFLFRQADIQSRSASLPPSMQSPNVVMPQSMQSPAASLAPSMQNPDVFLPPSAQSLGVSMPPSTQQGVPVAPAFQQAPVPQRPAAPPQPCVPFVPPCVVPPAPSLVGMRDSFGMAPPPVPTGVPRQTAIDTERLRARSPYREGLITKASRFVGGDLFPIFPAIDTEDEVGRHVGVGPPIQPWHPEYENAQAVQPVQPQQPRSMQEYHFSSVQQNQIPVPSQQAVLSAPPRLAQRCDATRSPAPRAYASFPSEVTGAVSTPVPNFAQKIDVPPSWHRTPLHVPSEESAPKAAFSFQRTIARDDSGLETSLFSTDPGRSRKLAGGRVAW